MKFNEHGHPRSAAWFLDICYDDPSDPFLGGVRLIVNSDHKAGKAALERSDSPESLLARSAMKVDVARQLFAVLAGDNRLEELGDVPEESVLGVANAMAESTLLMDLNSALRMYREDPVYFEQRLQHSYRYLED